MNNNSQGLNSWWKKIIICGIVGAVVGLLAALSVPSEDMSVALRIFAVFPIMPLGINLIYWGWIKTWGFMRKLNIFLVMSLVKWVILLFVTLLISYLVGFVAFPMAVVKAIKNED